MQLIPLEISHSIPGARVLVTRVQCALACSIAEDAGEHPKAAGRE